MIDQQKYTNHNYEKLLETIICYTSLHTLLSSLKNNDQLM